MDLNLDEATTIKVPTLIEVGVQGRRHSTRLPKPGEALQTVLGALGTLTHLSESGVKAVNGQIDGQPVALALIEGARFGQDDDGNTTFTWTENEQNC